MSKFLTLMAVVGGLLLTSPASANEINGRDAAMILENSVVALMNGSSTFCTGTYIGERMVLTAQHCTGNGNDYNIEFVPDMATTWAKWVTTPAGKKTDNERRFDWAVITTSQPMETVAEAQLGCKEEVYLGQPVAFLGYSQGRQQFGKGYVAAVVPAGNGRSNYDFAVDLTAAPGSSGSAIMSLDTGNIIGVLIEGVFDQRAGAYMIGVQSIADVAPCEDILAQ